MEKSEMTKIQKAAKTQAKPQITKIQKTAKTQAKQKISGGAGGQSMVLSTRDIFKSVGIIIISICAVFVCTLFLNYNIDLKALDTSLLPQEVQSFTMRR